MMATERRNLNKNNNDRGIQEMYCKISCYNPKEYNLIEEEDIEVRSFLLPDNNKEYLVYVNGDSLGSFKSVQQANEVAMDKIQRRKRAGWVILSRSENVRKRLES